MKKFTLLFMSLFLVLGTVMAQKDEASNEPVEFGIEWMSPEDGALATSVYNIMIGFTEDVIVTFPEGGFDVVNNDTKEVVKVTGYYEGDEYYPKNQVQFLFEQKLLPGKDGEEELQSVIIETPGSYSYTIPAGCIKSAKGEAFPETTFTFSIVATFPVGYNYTPQQTTAAIENIVVTFEQEITKVQLPEYPMSVLDVNNYYASIASVATATISEDKKTVTLELNAPITTPGLYTLKIDQGVFATADAINAYSTLYFEIIDTKPSFSTNYQNGDKVNEIGDLEITFKNVKDFEWTEDAVVELYAPTYPDPIKGKISKSEDGTKLIASFEGDFPEAEGYVYYISPGSFTMDGVANEAVEIEVNLSFLVITPLEVVSVTPEVGEIGAIEKITIKFNQYVNLYYDENGNTLSQNLTLTCGDKEYYLPCEGSSFISDELTYICATWDGNGYKYEPITTPGTYTLDLESIIVNHAAENIIETEWYSYAETWNVQGASCKGTYSWTVTGETAIENTKVADSEQVIYDLLGRRVEKIAGAGIYIVNGKKVIVK